MFEPALLCSKYPDNAISQKQIPIQLVAPVVVHSFTKKRENRIETTFSLGECPHKEGIVSEW